MLPAPRPNRPLHVKLWADDLAPQSQHALHDLDAAAVLAGLINAPAVLGLVDWPQLSYTGAQQMFSGTSHLSLPYYHGHRVRLHINQETVYTAAYDAQYGAQLSRSVIEHLRQGDLPMQDTFADGLAPELWLEFSALGAGWDAGAQALRPPHLGPPAGLPQIVLPPRFILEARLRAIDPSPWFQRHLVPELLGAAGVSMTPSRFINFYHLALSIAADSEDEGGSLAGIYLAPCNNLVLDALLPVPWLREHVAWSMSWSAYLEPVLFDGDQPQGPDDPPLQTNTNAADSPPND